MLFLQRQLLRNLTDWLQATDIRTEISAFAVLVPHLSGYYLHRRDMAKFY